MPPLPSELRLELDHAVSQARDIAEEGARASLSVLGVEAPAAPATLTPSDRDLRTALRARGRAIGGGVLPLGIDGLVEEIAYEQWHRMLFARFLAENGLLFHPGGASISMADVVELAAEERERDPWVLAARYASSMLPGIFRAEDPAHQVRFAPEHRARLEARLTALPTEVFRADDALGWVYQFWQSDQKKKVNKSGHKIGGADIPPVTQLFTEHYMVRFLLENSLGAWWAARHPESPLLRDWEFLRLREDGTPAAGTFDSWPQRAAEVTVMDPCMGSGHFLVAAGEMLRKMRVEEEGLSVAAAAVAVLRDNLFGLELDPRCTQLGAFALAFDAWKVAGYQALPVPNVACSGVAIKGQLEDWQRLAGGEDKMVDALERLYSLFQDAPELGSLIDPTAAAGDGLWRVDPAELLAKLETALAAERHDPAAAVFGAAADGTAKAARLLARSYWLVVTNPPYLSRSKQSETLRDYCDRFYRDGRPDLATSFIARCIRLADAIGGCVAIVSPQGWLSLPAYAPFRAGLLSTSTWLLAAPLGPAAFSRMNWWAATTLLWMVNTRPPGLDSRVGVVIAEEGRSPSSKARQLLAGDLRFVLQSGNLQNRASRVVLGTESSTAARLRDFARSYQGLKTGDDGRKRRCFWELATVDSRWRRMQSNPETRAPFCGRTMVVSWDMAGKDLARRQGTGAWGRGGVMVGLMGDLRVARYEGDVFDSNAAAIVPRDARTLPALWAYASSPQFASAVRTLESGAKVNSATVADVPFDLSRWEKVAAEQYPNGLPEPHSDDPTQWLFKGAISGSLNPLQVAVARLVGYQWPEQDSSSLGGLIDSDGIVALPPIAGEASASERLRVLLARSYGSDWSPTLVDRLLAGAGSPGSTLESWLRDGFFAQHARLFSNRPFVWQVWDGCKEGFSALLNYHRLNSKTLEKLTYTYLNSWIERQRAQRDEPGAEARLVAALDLQDKLKLILEGEPPYDIYVRWKPLAHQPLGWDPDIDDGVRLNIRPFVTAGILRAKFTVNWKKDRGSNPDGSERLNDRHFTRAQKLAAREGGDE